MNERRVSAEENDENNAIVEDFTLIKQEDPPADEIESKEVGSRHQELEKNAIRGLLEVELEMNMSFRPSQDVEELNSQHLRTNPQTNLESLPQRTTTSEKNERKSPRKKTQESSPLRDSKSMALMTSFYQYYL